MSFKQLKQDIGFSNSHAIVIGSGIAGLLSARVLAEHFNSVTIVEVDKLPENPDNRKGVPQSTQPHILLVRGYRILEEFFPGIGTDLLNAGALIIDWAQEFHRFTPKVGWNATAQHSSDIVSFTCSRPLLEWSVRQRLRSLANIRFVENYRVVDLTSNSSQTHITGTRLRSMAESNEYELQASLVVDASGRRSQAPKWLKNLGFTPPPETIVNPFLSYATRRYREPKGFHANWKVMLISQSPPDITRLGYLARIEGEEWIATLGGYSHDLPPLDDENFLKFARSLPNSKFYEAIKEAEPISPIYAHRATTNRLRHYDKVKVPNGFVCLGDAVCALCPVYGQGITVSALSAVVLQNWLKNTSNFSSDDSILSSDFQNSLAKSNSLHWSLAVAQDTGFIATKRFPPLEKKRTGGKISNLLRWYSRQFLLGTSVDADLSIVLIQVVNLLKHPLFFYHPKVVLRVLRISFSKN
jgi:2-polyprenyl-6-methoxyphenol hydroxylase-like FAD-dependent oxidoreductase